MNGELNLPDAPVVEMDFYASGEARKLPSASSSTSFDDGFENANDFSQGVKSRGIEDDKSKKEWIIGAYAVIALVWVFLTHILGLAPWTSSAKKHHMRGVAGWLVFFVPLIVIGLGALAVYFSENPCSIQNAVRSGNILYLGILVAIPLFALLDSSYSGDRKQFALIALSSMMVAVASQFDVWGSAEWTCVVHHVESALKTVSIGLLLGVIVLYANNGKYISKPHLTVVQNESK
jgi:hypothetical protein